MDVPFPAENSIFSSSLHVDSTGVCINHSLFKKKKKKKESLSDKV